MPTISEFYGIKVTMYYADHPPPHFHVSYGGFSAKVAIADGKVFRGDLPRRARRLVEEWWALHREALSENWDRLEADTVPHKIEPLT